jgi:hypothetical protein
MMPVACNYVVKVPLALTNKSITMFRLYSLFLILALISCKKEDSARTVADLVGNYSVSEEARNFVTGAIVQTNTFTASVRAGTASNQVLFDQSTRSPKPAWVGIYTDVMDLTLVSATDSLASTVQGGLLSGKIESDTKVKINYSYGAGSTAYKVDQVWSKQ